MYTLAELSTKLALEFSGRGDKALVSLAPLTTAGPDELSFISERRYLSQLASTCAAAVILHPDFVEQCPVDCLFSDEPYLTFARATALYDASPTPQSGVHPSASVSANSEIHPSAMVAANVVIESGVSLGADVRIDAGVFVGRDSRIGHGSHIYPNAVIYHDVWLGHHCEIHSQAVIGSDGFGYAPAKDGWVKIHQLGGVRIGNCVGIGAGSTVDRGALDHTVIDDGVIIDNQVHIAHNCSIGKNTAIAACCGMAGSTKIGANCQLAGMVGVTGHLEVCDGVHFTAGTMVTGSVTEPGSYSSGTQMTGTQLWRKNAVRLSQLDAMQRRLSKLEKR